MHQTRMLSLGLDVHKAAIAVVYVAKEDHAEVVSRGQSGTRPCASDHLIRQMPSKSKPLIFVSDAGPCGYWLSRSRPHKGPVYWVVAPSLIPPKPGERVTTTRRDALTLARLLRSGNLTPSDVPQGEAAAMRDRGRVRAEVIRELKTAQFRLKAWLRRYDLR